MAITKLLRLKESKKGNPAQHLINNILYICDREKTEGGLWIGGNAGQETATIISTMLRNKEVWNKEDGTQGFHYRKAFCSYNISDYLFQMEEKELKQEWEMSDSWIRRRFMNYKQAYRWWLKNYRNK